MIELDSDTIVGCADGFKLGYIEGWAWRPLRPHDPVIVQLLVDGVLQAEAAACVPRPDLQAAGIGDGHYAFALPLLIAPDSPPVLHITVRAKDGPVLPNGTFDVTTSPEDRTDLLQRQSTAYLEKIFGPLGGVIPESGATDRAPPVPRLNFILYAATAGAAMPSALGMPEYSYVFVMRGFREVLRRLGTVHVVRNPAEEVDDIHSACMARGETCLFLSFAPPQSTPLGLRCPTIPVIAWEFGTIPTGGWPGDPREDWRLVLRQTGRAMTISDFAARAIRATIGADYPVAFIPTPLWNRQTARPCGPPGDPVTLVVDGLVWDSRETMVSLDMRTPPLPHMARAQPARLPMRGAQLTLAILSAAAHAPPAEADFAAPAPARVDPVPLPTAKTFRTRLRMTAVFGRQWYREVLRDALPGPLVRLLSAAGRRLVARRTRPSPAHDAPATPAIPAVPEPELPPTARYLPVDPAARPDSDAPRPRYLPAPTDPMLPEPALAIFHPDPYPAAPRPVHGHSATVDGIVFTAVLAPKDGRKNWQDILSAFTTAFRDTPGATLVFKMIGADPSYWWSEFHSLVRTLPKFTCRVLVLSGYLDDENYHALIQATHIVVNGSLAEGQCLPLVEFMAARRPAIAPLHTAMLDYITPDNAVIVASAVEFCSWPHDPRNHFSTSRHRVEWPSLRDAFATAYRIAVREPERYQAMAEAAAASIREYCADAVVAPRLAAFLGLGDEVVLRAGWQPLPRPAAETLPAFPAMAVLPA
jgi:glycosyltransferase involved in cell wall biosynthesis